MIDDINGEYPERHRQRSRHGAAHDERNKLALNAVGVGLKRKHKRGNRADQHFKHQHVVGGEEVRAARKDTHERQRQREQGFHDIQGGGVLDVVDHPPSLVDDLRHRPKVIVLKDEVGNVSRGVAARSHGHGAVGLFHGEDIVDAVTRHGHRVARLFNGAD